MICFPLPGMNMTPVMELPSEDKIRTMKASGPYAVGQRQREAQISMIVQCVGRHQTTGEFVSLKMLQMRSQEEDRVCREMEQAKALIHNEHKLLSMLKGEKGVVRLRDFFMDYTFDEEDYDDDADEDADQIVTNSRTNQAEILTQSVDDDPFHLQEIVDAISLPSADGSYSQSNLPQQPPQLASPSSTRTRIPLSLRQLTLNLPSLTREESVRSVSDRRARSNHKRLPRLTLVTDCCHPHNLDPTSDRYLILQHYVIQERMLGEREAIRMFHAILRSIVNLHRLNVIHRDLKLGNVSFDRHRQEVILSSFCLGRHLIHDDELLTDQRGSPAYISPEVLSGRPYKGKPSDIWALGVMLFTMLFGGFPFYDHDPKKLFRKIKAGDFQFPPGYDDSESADVGGEYCRPNVTGRNATSSRRGPRSTPPPTTQPVGQDVLRLVRGMLRLDPASRLTAEEAFDSVESIIACWRRLDEPTSTLQMVPVFVPKDGLSEEKFASSQVVPSTTRVGDNEKTRERSPHRKYSPSTSGRRIETFRRQYREPSLTSTRTAASSIHRPSPFASSPNSLPSNSSHGFSAVFLRGGGGGEGGGGGAQAQQDSIIGVDGEMVILDLRM